MVLIRILSWILMEKRCSLIVLCGVFVCEIANAVVSIPEPCQRSLTSAYPSSSTDVNRTAALFGACDCSNATETGGVPCENGNPGAIFDIADRLIASIVTARIYNLYLGLDSPYPVASGTVAQHNLRSVIATEGRGSCAEVGACNLACGEGSTGGVSFTMPSNASTVATALAGGTSSTTVMPGLYGYTSSTATPKPRTPLFSNLTTASSGKIVDDVTFNVKKSDFYAKGVFPNPDPTPTGVLTPGPQASASFPAGSVYIPPAVGWPAQGFSTSSPSNLCVAAPPADQPNFGSHTAYCYTLTENHSLPAFNWIDSSSGFQGTNACNFQYSADYRNATTITALDVGALVQATWSALDQVKTEITTAPYKLILTDPVCQTLAAGTSSSNGYSRSIELVAASLIAAQPSPGPMSRSTLAEMKARCNADARTSGQTDCYQLGLISTLQTAAFVPIAQCEVIQRANQLFQKAYVGAKQIVMLNQLKNWASVGCLTAGGSEANHQAPNYCTRTGHATSASCDGGGGGRGRAAATPTVLAGRNLYGDLFADEDNTNPCRFPNAGGSDRCIYNIGDLLGNDCMGYVNVDVKWAYAGGVNNKRLSNCFPYAYTAALQSYLSTIQYQPPDTVGTLSFVSNSTTNKLQQLYTSRVMVSGRPQVSLENCQITDRTPGHSAPSPRPNN